LDEQVLDIDGQRIAIVRHPRRKRLALRVRQAQVEVLSPFGVSLLTLQRFAKQHQPWWQAQLEVQPVSKPLFSWRAELKQVWPFLGESYALQSSASSRVVCEDGGLYCPWLQTESARRRLLLTWYQQQAALYLAERTAHFARALGRAPNAIQIKTYRARWGSCDSRARIQYNWKLMCLPPWVMDYVVVHELCHLVYMNHSAEFWALVAHHYPATADAKAWLKQHGSHYI
jgi:hypothetical protein